MWDGKDPGLSNEQTTRQEAAKAREVDRAAAVETVRELLRTVEAALSAGGVWTRTKVTLWELVATSLNAGADFHVRAGEVLR